MAKVDEKILNWMMKGSAEYNRVGRHIDLQLFEEALVGDYKKIFRHIRGYFEKHKIPPTYRLLTEELIDDLDQAMAAECIKEANCPEGELGFYIDKLKDRYNSFLAKCLAEAVDAENLDVEEYNSDLLRISAKIERLRASTIFSEGDLKDTVDERIGNYEYTRDNPGEIEGVFTGYAELDDYTFGIRNSEMMVISGASSSGKSMLMMNIAINAWLGSNDPLNPDAEFVDDGKNVIYYTLEMSKSQLETRIDANVGRIRHKALSRGFMTDEELSRWERVLEFQKKYDKKFYIVDIPRGSRVIDVEARYDSISAEFEPELVCVDYLGIMRPNRDYGQDWLEVGNVAADLHEFCRNKNKPVITAAQRKTRDKKSKKSHNDLEELGRSKMIGDNANIVLLIGVRDEEYLLEDMEIHVVKNRDGKKGKILLQKEFDKSRINDYPDGWAEDNGDENEIWPEKPQV